MTISFSKYQGAGNDFILLDNRDGRYDTLSIETIQRLCDRKFGIGADGLIKINSHPTLDFEADYYNADGSKSFCGNGGRCAVSFSHKLGLDVATTRFMGFDGEHLAHLADGIIRLKMADVYTIQSVDGNYELYTGSPHYVHFSTDIQEFDIYSFGRMIRYNDQYAAEGINVNVVEELENDYLFVRTYERGVEDETYACGTGVTAVAMAMAKKQNQIGQVVTPVTVLGGNLEINFSYDGQKFTDVFLCGPAERVFEGEIEIS